MGNPGQNYSYLFISLEIKAEVVVPNCNRCQLHAQPFHSSLKQSTNANRMAIIPGKHLLRCSVNSTVISIDWPIDKSTDRLLSVCTLSTVWARLSAAVNRPLFGCYRPCTVVHGSLFLDPTQSDPIRPVGPSDPWTTLQPCRGSNASKVRRKLMCGAFIGKCDNSCKQIRSNMDRNNRRDDTFNQIE